MFWVIIMVVAVYFVLTYNSLVNVKHNVSIAWSNIDVLLKQRHDELPKLIDTCKQYMKHEQETLEKVIQARSRVSDARESQNIASLGMAEQALRSGLSQYLPWLSLTLTLRRMSNSCICSHVSAV